MWMDPYDNKIIMKTKKVTLRAVNNVCYMKITVLCNTEQVHTEVQKFFARMQYDIIISASLTWRVKLIRMGLSWKVGTEATAYVSVCILPYNNSYQNNFSHKNWNQFYLESSSVNKWIHSPSTIWTECERLFYWFRYQSTPGLTLLLVSKMMWKRNAGYFAVVVACMVVLLLIFHEGSAESYQDDLVLTLKQKHLLDKVENIMLFCSLIVCNTSC